VLITYEFRDDLQRIHTGGRALLSLVKDYFDDEHFSQKRPNEHRMYHELRTPVNHIVGYTELLIEVAEDRGVPQLQTDFERIRNAAGTWLTLMEEYLISPHGPRLETEPVALPPGIRYVVPSADEASSGAAIKGRLLVVDDDASNREMLARRLKRMGHTVETAENGATSLQKLRTESFDAVLLDLVMPGLDGYQALVRIKSETSLASVRVIMLSALDQEQGVARCLEAGADDFIAKPFNSVLLRARLGACLEKKFLRDRERQFLLEIQAEREKSERLLRNILPQSIAAPLVAASQLAEELPEIAQCAGAEIAEAGDVRISFGLCYHSIAALNTVFAASEGLLSAAAQAELTERVRAVIAAEALPKRRPRSCACKLRQPVSKWPRMIESESLPSQILCEILILAERHWPISNPTAHSREQWVIPPLPKVVFLSSGRVCVAHSSLFAF
jgi:CheY-like chemotaxis protein